MSLYPCIDHPDCDHVFEVVTKGVTEEMKENPLFRQMLERAEADALAEARARHRIQYAREHWRPES